MIVHDEYSQVKAILAIKEIDLDKKWELSIKPYRSSKTAAQLGLYRVWVRIIADHFGEFEDDMHEYLKETLITPKYITIDGITKSVRHSVAKMKIDEMAEYMNKVSMWAGTHGISLPHPEEMHDGR